MVRAMATRCFSPPDNFKPRSPTTVASPSVARRAGAIETRSATERVNFTLVGMAVIEFGIMVVIMSLFRNWVISPIGKIREATEEIAAGNLDYRLSYRRRDELGNLAIEVNHMAESLSTAQRSPRAPTTRREKAAVARPGSSKSAASSRGPGRSAMSR